MTNEEYHADWSHVSKTMLSLFLESETDYFLTYVTGQKKPKGVGKPAVIGSIGHAVLCEDKKLNQVAVVYPPDCLNVAQGLISKYAKPFEAECAAGGYYCLKPNEYVEVETMLTEVKKNPELAPLLEQATTKEQAYFTELAGVKIKCKPDLLCDIGNEIYIYDLKLMPDIYPGAFYRSAKRFKYWLQVAHYSAVIRQITGKPVHFRFLVIETKFPYRVKPRRIPQSQCEQLVGDHIDILKRLKNCHDTKNWEDSWSPEVIVNPWDYEQSDDSLIPFDFDESNTDSNFQF